MESAPYPHGRALFYEKDADGFIDRLRPFMLEPGARRASLRHRKEMDA